MRRDPRHAYALRPPRRRRRPGRGHRGTGLRARARGSCARESRCVLPGHGRPAVHARRPPDGRRAAHARRPPAGDAPSPGSLAGPPRLPRRRRAALRGRALRRLRRPRRSALRRLGHARRLDHDADGALPSRHGRLSRTRPADDAGRGARPQPLPGRGARAAAGGAGRERLTKFEAPRGTHDILPNEWPAWHRVLDTAEELCELYDYRRIQTPGFEDTEVFARTSGPGSDVVQKEMYTFTDRAERSLTLRPEATAPIARAYLEHGLHKEAQPQKLYTIAPMYRYGAPQRGRFREHWPLSVEALGSDDPAIDAEVIQLYDELLHRLGVTDYQ